MSLEELVIAHKVVNWLLPDELEALVDLLERAPLPASTSCVVPLVEFRRLVAAEFGEESRAVRQLDSLILLGVGPPTPHGGLFSVSVPYLVVTAVAGRLFLKVVAGAEGERYRGA